MTKNETILFNALLKAQNQLLNLNILVDKLDEVECKYFKDEHRKSIQDCNKIIYSERFEEFDNALKIYKIK